MIEIFQLPQQFNIEVICSYKGERVGADFFEKNKSLRHLYISQGDFNVLYQKIKSQTKKGMKSLIEVTETGTKEYLNYKPL